MLAKIGAQVWVVSLLFNLYFGQQAYLLVRTEKGVHEKFHETVEFVPTEVQFQTRIVFPRESTRKNVSQEKINYDNFVQLRIFCRIDKKPLIT